MARTPTPLDTRIKLTHLFMTTSHRFSSISARTIIAATLASSSVFALALPSFAHASTYAFVNTSGEVNAVTADSWTLAIANAINIAIHSGVVLLTSQNQNILDTRV